MHPPLAPLLFQPVDPRCFIATLSHLPKNSARPFRVSADFGSIFFSFCAYAIPPGWMFTRNIVEKPNAFAVNAEEGAHDLRFTVEAEFSVQRRRHGWDYIIRIEPCCPVAPREPPIRHRAGTA